MLTDMPWERLVKAVRAEQRLEDTWLLESPRELDEAEFLCLADDLPDNAMHPHIVEWFSRVRPEPFMDIVVRPLDLALALRMHNSVRPYEDENTWRLFDPEHLSNGGLPDPSTKRLVQIGSTLGNDPLYVCSAGSQPWLTFMDHNGTMIPFNEGPHNSNHNLPGPTIPEFIDALAQAIANGRLIPDTNQPPRNFVYPEAPATTTRQTPWPFYPFTWQPGEPLSEMAAFAMPWHLRTDK